MPSIIRKRTERKTEPGNNPPAKKEIPRTSGSSNQKEIQAYKKRYESLTEDQLKKWMSDYRDKQEAKAESASLPRVKKPKTKTSKFDESASKWRGKRVNKK